MYFSKSLKHKTLNQLEITEVPFQVSILFIRKVPFLFLFLKTSTLCLCIHLPVSFSNVFFFAFVHPLVCLSFIFDSLTWFSSDFVRKFTDAGTGDIPFPSPSNLITPEVLRTRSKFTYLSSSRFYFTFRVGTHWKGFLPEFLKKRSYWSVTVHSKTPWYQNDYIIFVYNFSSCLTKLWTNKKRDFKWI